MIRPLIKEQLEKGISFSLQAEVEVELAEKINVSDRWSIENQFGTPYIVGKQCF